MLAAAKKAARSAASRIVAIRKLYAIKRDSIRCA
jgi:hypothetical protein